MSTLDVSLIKNPCLFILKQLVVFLVTLEEKEYGEKPTRSGSEYFEEKIR